MKNITLILSSILALSLTACGGGGGGDSSGTNPTPQTAAHWGQSTLAFGGSSVGSTSQMTATITNDGTSTADYSHFTGLPSGLTAVGCASVAAGTSCDVTFTYQPTSTGDSTASVNATGSNATALTVTATGTDASTPAISRHTYAGNVTSWTGTLTVNDPSHQPVVVTSVKDAGVSTSETCTVVFQGSHATDYVGHVLEVGNWYFKFPATGTVGTSGGVTSTTFTQPATTDTCYTVFSPAGTSEAVSIL